jgi:hypothetical protein
LPSAATGTPSLYPYYSGEVLYYYMTHLYPDTEYRSIVSLLIYCFDTTDYAYSFLEKIVRKNRKLTAVYPAYDKIDISKIKFVGEIPDSLLYLK